MIRIIGVYFYIGNSGACVSTMADARSTEIIIFHTATSV